MLREGGNAVDAAVTTALCQGVFNPMASGAGGGGFITVLSPNGSAEIIDARETAPGAANETMYKGAAWRLLHVTLTVAVGTYCPQSVSVCRNLWFTECHRATVLPHTICVSHPVRSMHHRLHSRAVA